MGREEVHIFRDALVRVIGLARHELHPIVGAIGQPGAEVAVGQPASPADLEHLVEIDLVNGKEDEDADQPRDAQQLPAKGHEVLVLERAVEGVVPLIQENREVDHAEREEHDGEQEPPGRPPVLREPVRADHGPGTGKRAAQADFGRTLGGVGAGSARVMAASARAIADGRVPELVVPVPIPIHEPPPETPFVASPTRDDRSRSDCAASEGHYSGFAGVVSRRRAFA